MGDVALGRAKLLIASELKCTKILPDIQSSQGLVRLRAGEQRSTPPASVTLELTENGSSAVLQSSDLLQGWIKDAANSKYWIFPPRGKTHEWTEQETYWLDDLA